ncbi:hypothetical protein [Entomomonas asaccharolytica]|uniref:Lipoprotein n=1 Tax=Entomomonas asaccharolytica TaxID=2785331 RepID=A0A974NFN0_9GAMM|nr:hypothetical protein [Entomomonas asaccharolytica]QQP85813.1 hypothetical protein JHT90_00680 [Entomomonas asaccharolytica]
MNTHIKLLAIPFLACLLVACSPAEPPAETFLDSQKQALDKAKTVEQIGLDHKKDIDNILKKSDQN